MRSSKNRSRSKGNRNRSVGNIVNRVFDSSGPEGKVRGTPQQIIDKYNQLARDAQLGNDRVAFENFQQHAEHYLRMLAEAQREQEARREQQQNNQNQQQNSQQGGGQQDGGQRDRNQQDRNQQDKNQQDRSQQDGGQPSRQGGDNRAATEASGESEGRGFDEVIDAQGRRWRPVRARRRSSIRIRGRARPRPRSRAIHA
jgi:hypothetical protein